MFGAPLYYEGVQSALEPTGPNAERIATLSWVMFWGAGIIFVVVMALTAYAILVPQERRRWLADRRTVIIGGIAFPVVALTALLVYGLSVAARSVRADEEPQLRIEVVGERWWWRVHYLGREGEPPVAISANEIHIPVGRPVQFRLLAADVIHSFWVPKLGGKLDMIPGQLNDYQLRADVPGIFRGQCAEYCGGAHALMAFYVVAHEPEAFEQWLLAQARPAAAPVLPMLERGRALFLSSGCGGCHRIAGTPADGTIGPDLTHVGGRLSIGAGMWPNNVGTIAGWIADSQHLKPDNLMPSFSVFTGEELRAIAAYLESLK